MEYGKEKDIQGPKIGSKQPTKLWSPTRERTWGYQYKKDPARPNSMDSRKMR